MKGFSKAARLRMLKFVATIDWTLIPKILFVTLTYPDECHGRSVKQRVQDRQLFLRKVEDFLGRRISGIWRIEWQPRKTGKNKGTVYPHYHLLLFDVRFIPYQEMNAWWKSVIHHTGYVRTEVKVTKAGRQTAYYVSKYMAKMPEECSLVNGAQLGAHGRHYGYHRKGGIPRHEQVIIRNPNREQFAYLKRLFEEFRPGIEVNDEETVTGLGSWCEHLRKILLEMELTHDHHGE